MSDPFVTSELLSPEEKLSIRRLQSEGFHQICLWDR
jgi:hypothetical protein